MSKSVCKWFLGAAPAVWQRIDPRSAIRVAAQARRQFVSALSSLSVVAVGRYFNEISPNHPLWPSGRSSWQTGTTLLQINLLRNVRNRALNERTEGPAIMRSRSVNEFKLNSSLSRLSLHSLLIRGNRGCSEPTVNIRALQ